MVADAVESASRTLSDPTPARLEGLVSDLSRQTAPRRPVRRVRAHPPRNRRDPRQPDQVAHRHLPRTCQVPRTSDGMRRATDLKQPVTPAALARALQTANARAGVSFGRSLMGPEIEVEISNTQGHLRVDLAALDRLVRIVLAARGPSRGSISIALVDNATIHAINRTHLGHDWPTDVISFPSLRPPTTRSWPASWSSPPRWPARPRARSASSPTTSWPCTWSTDCCTSAASTTTTTPIAQRMRRREDELLSRAGVTNPLRQRSADPFDRRGQTRFEPQTAGPRVLPPYPAAGGPSMDGMSLAWMLALGLPILALHLVSIALTKALQSYSRSLLEERCDARGRPERAEEVEHWDHKTERAAEALAVLTGLLLAALMGRGRAVWRVSPHRVAVVIVPVLVIGLLGYVIAGVVGKVFAEIIIDRALAAGGHAPRGRVAADVRSAASRASGGIALRPLPVARIGRPICSSRSPWRTTRPTKTTSPTLPESARRPAAAGDRLDSHGCRRADDAAVVDRFAPLDRLGRGGRRDLSQNRSLAGPDLRGKSRRHRGHPLRQGLVRPNDRGAAPLHDLPSRSGSAGALRAGEQERLRSRWKNCGLSAHTLPSSSMNTAAWRAW